MIARPIPFVCATATLRRTVRGMFVAACLVLIVVAVARLDSGAGDASPETAHMLRLLALNALPVLGVFGVILALTRRAFLSAWLVVLALVVLHAINQAKLDIMQAPLLPADFRLFADPGTALTLLSKYVRVDAWHGLLIGCALGFTLLLCRERPWATLSAGRAWILAGIAATLVASIVAGTRPWPLLYPAQAMGFQVWELAGSSRRVGLIGNLLLYHWQLGNADVPAGDVAAATAFLRRHEPALRAALATTRPAQLPDIVVVQSESLFDPARLNDVPEGYWLRAYHRLRQTAASGDMQVPTFVGGTVRTEFEVLTGAPLASLGGIQYPWLELDAKEMPSLASLLGAHGYARTAIHPNPGSFWNRSHTYPRLGFESFIDGSQFDESRIVGLFVSDEAMTDRILAELDEDGPPQFLFAISMENHGPFDWRPNLDADRLAALPIPAALDDGARGWLANYLYLLDDADRELGRLADALRMRSRRTVLLFYGDHLPGLEPVYAGLGFKDGREAAEQPVPWLLMDSDAIDPLRLDTRSWMLPGLLLDKAGVHDDVWFSLLATLARDPQFDPDSAQTAEGLYALARLRLRGELAPVAAAILDPAVPDA